MKEDSTFIEEIISGREEDSDFFNLSIGVTEEGENHEVSVLS